MTNNIVDVDASALFDSLYNLFCDFLMPFLTLMIAVWGVKLIVKVFKRVGHP